MRLNHRTATFILTLVLGVFVSTGVMAQERCDIPPVQAPFKGIVSFGDSLSDTGNLFADTGFPPSPFYFDGRFSNGIVWTEYLAIELGIDPESVEDYSYGGATTGRDNFNDPFFGADFPGLQDELDVYLQRLGRRPADRRTLYTIWAGANDLFIAADPVLAIEGAVQNTATAVQRLHGAGARRIMVVNLPDLGLTPFGLENDPAGFSFLTFIYNVQLEAKLDELDAAGYDTIRIDAAGLLQQVVSDPGAFGLTNVTDRGQESGTGGAGYLFWDGSHPTTQGHALFAIEAMEVLSAEFGHVWSTPPAGR